MLAGRAFEAGSGTIYTVTASGKVREGDIIRVGAVSGMPAALVACTGSEQDWVMRQQTEIDTSRAQVNAANLGRELFGTLRRNMLHAEEGAITWLQG